MLTGRRRQQQAIVQVVNAIMTEYKLTQLTLAARCELPKSTLSDYLTGKHTVSIELVGRLLNVFPTYTAQIVVALAGTTADQPASRSYDIAANPATSSAHQQSNPIS